MIFKLGYKITDLKQEIKRCEVKNQDLMKQVHSRCSLANIDRKARDDFNMQLPEPSDIEVLRVNKQEIKDYNLQADSLLVYIKNLFSPGEARAE
ncbi:MAG: hypothetical protein ACQEQC_00160 [Elusimicrobiota bacterium]